MKKILPLLAMILLIAILGCRGEKTADEFLNESISAKTKEARKDIVDDEMAPAPTSARNISSQTALLSETPLSTRMIIKTAAISIEVDDVDKSYSKAIALTEAAGGYLLSGSNYQEDDYASADITIKVSPKAFSKLITSLEDLGKVTSKSISGQDVTEEYLDLRAELQTQEALRARLFQLLNKSKNVDEAIRVEQELQRVDYNVNRIKGRIKYLEQMVGESTISLSLYSGVRQPTGELLGNILLIIASIFAVLIPLGLITAGIAWLVIRVKRSYKLEKK